MKTSLTLKEQIENYLVSDKVSAKVTKIVLAVIGLAGVLTIAAVSPNIFVAIDYFLPKGQYSREQIQKAFSYLKKRKYITVHQIAGNKMKVELSFQGETKLREAIMENLSVPPQEKWDRKWRVVVFDIPEKQKIARQSLRKKIRELGFQKLQHSVWIYPYPCKNELLYIADFFQVSRYIEILTVENLLHEEDLKQHFNL